MMNFWETPLIQHYTRHGIDHSKRIIEILENLLKNYPNLLNDYECFILISAAHLHDIGMQSPIYAGLPQKLQYSLEDMSIIREKHNESSAKMIEDSVSGKSNLSLGVGECKDFAKFIAITSKYHRALDLNQLENSSIAGKEIKLPLIASLLRLADELDSDYQRVNMELLKLREIPIESKYHWWCHYYVQSILIDSGYIKIYFRFPSEYQDSSIKNILSKKTIKSIGDHLVDVYEILYCSGIKLYPKPKVGGEEYHPTGVLIPIPDDLFAYILSTNKDIKPSKDNIKNVKKLFRKDSSKVRDLIFK